VSYHSPRCGYVGAPDDPQRGCTCGGESSRPRAPTEPTTAPPSSPMTAEEANRIYQAAFLAQSEVDSDMLFISDCKASGLLAVATEAAARTERRVLARLEATLVKRVETAEWNVRHFNGRGESREARTSSNHATAFGIALDDVRALRGEVGR
jgi:hypothetical protein